MKKDPRIILCEKLIKTGIERHLAFDIALSAGSSQEYVDRWYINDLKVTKAEEEIIIEKVSRFYMGYYHDEES